MALLFWEGFDSYASIEQLETAKPYIVSNWQAAYSTKAVLTTTGGRFGKGRIGADNYWGWVGLINISSFAQPTEIYSGRAAYTDTDNILGGVWGSALDTNVPDIYCEVASSGVIYVTRFNANNTYTSIANSGAAVFTYNTWNWVEFRARMSTNNTTADGAFEVWLNNTKVVSANNIITKRNNSSTYWAGTTLNFSTQRSQQKMDDIYIVDTSGPAPWNTRLGDCRMVSLPPVKNGVYNTNTSIGNVGISYVFSNADITVSNGGVSVYIPGGRQAKSTHYTASGNLYFEVTVRDSYNSGADELIGITDRRSAVWVNGLGPAYGFGVKPFQRTIYSNQTAVGSIPATLAAGNTLCFAVNFDAGKFWIKPNPSSDWNSNTSANPANGAGAYTFSNPSFVTLAPYIEADNGSTYNINYGSYAFSGTVPSGFSAWNSLNGNSACFINENSGYTTDSVTVPNSPNNYETYAFANLASNVSSVIAAAIVTVERKVDAGYANVKHVIVSGQAYNSASIPLTTSPAIHRTEWITNPNTGLAWTKTQINSAQTGIVIE